MKLLDEIRKLTVVPRIPKRTLKDHPHLEEIIKRIVKLIERFVIIGAKVIVLNSPHNSGKTLVLKNLKEGIPNTHYCCFNLDYITDKNNLNPEEFLYLNYLSFDGFQSPMEEVQIFIFDHLELLYKFYQNEESNISNKIEVLLNKLSMYSKNEHMIFLISIPTEFIMLSEEISAKSGGFINIISIKEDSDELNDKKNE